MKNPKFQVYIGRDGQFYFRLLARNGQNILSGEGYTARSGCNNGIESVKKNAPHDERYERRKTGSGKSYFVLTATNGQVIGRSQMYTTAQSRNRGIEAVKGVAPDAPVEDATA